MVKLSEFLGELVSDISDARKIADKNSITISQSYSADPFLKGMPVPHYTINEAEIKVPVTVVGVQTDVMETEKNKSALVSSVRKKLPAILLENMKNFYIKRQTELNRKQKEENNNDEPTKTNGSESDEQQLIAAENNVEITDKLIKTFTKSAGAITQNLIEPMRSYLETANFELIKLLDIRDEFKEMLKLKTKEELSGYTPQFLPVTDETIEPFLIEVGTKMFYEFKRIFNVDKGLCIEPSTGNMNEYCMNGNQMHLTIKVTEQDLNLVIEEGEEKGVNRFLSLN